ncbi:MAG: hypothetical protein ACTSP4_09255 [Candidatus Hodarchaeales archaeon]
MVMFMDRLTIFQQFSGLTWLILGFLLVIWLLNPIEELMTIIWWGFALGCFLTGIWMLLEPASQDK